MKWRKKPVVIDAIQWNQMGDHDSVKPIPQSVLEREMKEGVFAAQRGVHPSLCGWIGTIEGGHIVSPGDFIITGIQGEQYPCKPDIFAKTYEPADEPPSPQEQGWVSVEERLPEAGELVQVWQANKFGAFNEAIGARTDQVWIVYYDTSEEVGYYKSEYITHWRQRTEPSKK